MNSIIEILASWASTQPTALFTADLDSAYTYAEAYDTTRRIASALVAHGITRGDRVLVECTQDTTYLLTDLALELTGAMIVPIEHKAGEDRVRDIVEETSPVLFIGNTTYAVETPMLAPADLLAKASEITISPDLAFPAAEDVVELLYTTGTTGKSKGIEVMSQNNVAIAENIMYGVEMKPGNVEIVPLPLSHSHGIRCCYANILNGGAIIVTNGVMNVRGIFHLLTKYTITAMDLSPSAAQILLRLSKGKLADFKNQLDYIQIGTAALPEETKQALLDLLPGVRLYNFYGSTESGRTCVLDFSKTNRPNCIGRPTKNAQFIIVDDERHVIESSAENTGLVATAGAMNMKGYYKQPELTAKTMQNGYIYTNDLGYIDAEGYVYVLGRKDDIINYKGIKIAPEEIEEAVKKFHGIVDCACVPKKDPIAGQVPKLFISVRNADKFDRSEFYAFLETQLDANKMPKEIAIIDEIPRTYNGKLQRGKLIEA